MKSNADISLPPEADLPKGPWERPSWVPLYLYLGCVIALALVAIALDASGGGAVTAAVGIALALASLLLLVSGFAVGTFIVRRFVSHTPDSFHAADPQEQPLGAMLSCPLEQFPMTAFTKLLSDEQKQQLEEHRAQERDLSRAYFADVAPARMVETASSDGTQLVAYALEPNPDSCKWVIAVHGYKGDWPEHMMHARRYAEHGYNLLFPVLRGHAASGGAFIGLGLADAADLSSWARWLVDAGAETVVLHGHSMGGTAVCMAGAEETLPLQVKAIVADCAYSDAWNAATLIAREGMHLLCHPSLELARFVLMHSKGGYDIQKVDVAAVAPQMRVPVLVIHGQADCVVQPSMAERIYDAAPAGSKLVFVPGAGHCLAALTDPELYYDALFGFLHERE